MNACQFLSTLTIPAWLTNRKGVVLASVNGGVAVGKDGFAGIASAGHSGLAYRNRGKVNEIRFYYRRVKEGYLCAAFPYLSRMPDPYGARLERITSTLDELVEQLSFYAEQSCMESDLLAPIRFWLAIWDDPKRLPTTSRLVHSAPDLLQTAWEASLYRYLFSLLGPEYTVQYNLPTESFFRREESLARYQMLCALLIWFRRSTSIRQAELNLMEQESRLITHLRLRFQEGIDPELAKAISQWSQAEDKGLAMLSLTCLMESEHQVSICLSAAPAPTPTLHQKWRDVEDTVARKLFDSLLLIADGFFSVMPENKQEKLPEKANKL